MVWLFLVPVHLYAESAENISLKDILESPTEHKKVSVDGLILKRLDKDTYLIQDGTAAVPISIPAELTPKGGFVPKNHISFEGNLDLNWGKGIEIDVDSLTFSF